MTPRLSGHFSLFGLIFFVLKSLLGIARQWSREKFAVLNLKPRILQQDGNWDESTFVKTSGTVAKDNKKNWPIADRRVPSNDYRNNCKTHFVSSSLLVKGLNPGVISKVG